MRDCLVPYCRLSRIEKCELSIARWSLYKLITLLSQSRVCDVGRSTQPSCYWLPRASSWQRLSQLIASIEESRKRECRDRRQSCEGSSEQAGTRTSFKGISEMEGKAATGSGENGAAGKRTSFKWAGAHKSTWATSEFHTERELLPTSHLRLRRCNALTIQLFNVREAICQMFWRATISVPRRCCRTVLILKATDLHLTT